VLVDVDAAVLDRAAARRLPRSRTVCADATAAGAVPAASADVVVLSAILEHLEDPGAALRAWAPALAPGGRFVVYVPADGPILLAKRLLRATGLFVLARGVSLDPAPGHVVRFTRASLAALVSPHGAVVEISFDPLCLGYAAVVRCAANRVRLRRCVRPRRAWRRSEVERLLPRLRRCDPTVPACSSRRIALRPRASRSTERGS
jgi:SAM-dependent methyltransferase